MAELTPEQIEALKRLMADAPRPGDRDLVRGLTADDLREHADRSERQQARIAALEQAGVEMIELMEKHGCAKAGELDALGIANPFREVAERILRAHAQGELSDDELKELRIRRNSDGGLVITRGPLTIVETELTHKLHYDIQGLAHQDGTITIIAIRDGVDDETRKLLHEIEARTPGGRLVNTPPEAVDPEVLEQLTASLLENPERRIALIDVRFADGHNVLHELN